MGYPARKQNASMSHTVVFEDAELTVRPHSVHEWLLTTADVAAGLGVSVGSVYMTKSRRAAELREGRHYITGGDESLTETTLTICEGGPERVLWTKRGVVRLGFWARSERAARFRDWAEDLVIAADEGTQIVSTPSAGLDLSDLGTIERLHEGLGRAIEIARINGERAELAESKVAELEPKSNAYDKLIDSDGLIDLTSIADALSMNVRALTRWLVERDIFRKQTSEMNGRNLPRKRYQPDYFEIKWESNGMAIYPVAYATGAGVQMVVDLFQREQGAA